MFFKGQFEHSLDDKNRLFIPAKFREGLGDSFVIHKALFEQCLFAYSQEDFEAISEKLETSSAIMDEELQDLERYLYSSASDVSTDKQGRALIPANLKEYAALEREVVIIGAQRHVEIWSAEQWKEKCAHMTTESLRSIAVKLKERGIRL